MKRWKSQDTAVDISFSRRFLSRWRGVIFHFPHWWSSKDWWQFIKHKLIMINADWSLIMYSLDNSLFFPRPGWPVSAIRTAQGGRKTSSGSWDSAIMTINHLQHTCQISSQHWRFCAENKSSPVIGGDLYISCVSHIVCKATLRQKLSKKANCSQIERKMLSF